MLEGRPRVNTDLTGTVRMMGEADSAIRVEIHLEDEELRLVSAHGELGRWPLSDIGVAAKLDGFHLRIEGEELVISTNDDARFAIALGIRSSSSPRLNRLLAGARDDGMDIEGRMAPDTPQVPVEYRVRAVDLAQTAGDFSAPVSVTPQKPSQASAPGVIAGPIRKGLRPLLFVGVGIAGILAGALWAMSKRRRRHF